MLPSFLKKYPQHTLAFSKLLFFLIKCLFNNSTTAFPYHWLSFVIPTTQKWHSYKKSFACLRNLKELYHNAFAQDLSFYLESNSIISRVVCQLKADVPEVKPDPVIAILLHCSDQSWRKLYWFSFIKKTTTKKKIIQSQAFSGCTEIFFSSEKLKRKIFPL